MIHEGGSRSWHKEDNSGGAWWTPGVEWLKLSAGGHVDS